MRKLFTIIFLLPVMCMATNRYFDATLGNDSNVGTLAAPWQTITKLNSIFASLSNGDSILFKAGDTFTGTIIANHSNIIISRYGTGADPIITGFYTIPAWTNVGTNLWQSTAAVSTLSTCKIISINGSQVAKGRTPNTDYWTIVSRAANSITDAVHLNASITNWTGATVVMRKYRWVTDAFVITSASGGTLNFTNSGDATQAGYGYFIQDDPRCLDLANEWSYNTTTKKITIYSTGSPTAVIQVPTSETAIDLNGESNITIDNITITGYNSIGVDTESMAGIIIQNCQFSFIGGDGIDGYPNSADFRVTGCTFTDIGSRGIRGGASDDAYIANNDLNRIGYFAGMGSNGDDSYTGIIAIGDRAQVLNNSVQYVGYCGIRWDGNSTLIKNNFINYHNRIKDDGGGIYSYPSALGPVPQNFLTRTVEGNIVINGVGAAAGGAPSSSIPEAYGIYADGTSPDIIFLNNTIATAYLGLFLNGSHQITVRGNTIYDCTRGMYVLNYNPSIGIADITIRANIFVAKEADQYAAYYEPAAGAMPATFDADSNIYARPVDDNLTIWIDSLGNNRYKSLAQWKASAFASGEDANSTKSPIAVANSSSFNFQYNNTSSEVVKTLGATYIDMSGVTHPGYTTLGPYESFLGLYLDSYNPVFILRNTKVIKE